jgi:hypothetical protein
MTWRVALTRHWQTGDMKGVDLKDVKDASDNLSLFGPWAPKPCLSPLKAGPRL